MANRVMALSFDHSYDDRSYNNQGMTTLHEVHQKDRGVSIKSIRKTGVPEITKVNERTGRAEAEGVAISATHRKFSVCREDGRGEQDGGTQGDHHHQGKFLHNTATSPTGSPRCDSAQPRQPASRCSAEHHRQAEEMVNRRVLPSTLAGQGKAFAA